MPTWCASPTARRCDVLCREENGFRLDAADLERAITPKTRWLLLNSPSNPTGAAYSAAQLRPILDVLKRHPHVWLMADDIYEHLIYDGMPFVTAAALEPSLKSRTLTVNGVSKAYAMTGWRVGYGGGPRELIAAMAVVQSQSTTNPSSVSQAAAIAALTGPQDVADRAPRRVPAPPRHRGRCAQRHRRRHLPPAGRRVLYLCELRRPDRPPHAGWDRYR